MGIVLSFLETNYYYSQRSYPALKRFHQTTLISMLHVCNVVYLLTSDYQGAYCGGINLFALAILISFPLTFVWLVLSTMRARRHNAAPPDMEPVIASLTSILLLVTGGSPLIPLWNFQARQILPCLFAKTQDRKESPFKVSHLGIQASTVYVIVQAAWVLWFVWGLIPDLEVDLRAGVPGVWSWNDLPTLSAVLLALRKVFFLSFFPSIFIVASLLLPHFLL